MGQKIDLGYFQIKIGKNGVPKNRNLGQENKFRIYQ